MFKWLLSVRAFIWYQIINAKSNILEKLLRIWPKSQAETPKIELPIKRKVCRSLTNYTTYLNISWCLRTSLINFVEIVVHNIPKRSSIWSNSTNGSSWNHQRWSASTDRFVELRLIAKVGRWNQYPEQYPTVFFLSGGPAENIF